MIYGFKKFNNEVKNIIKKNKKILNKYDPICDSLSLYESKFSVFFNIL